MATWQTLACPWAHWAISRATAPAVDPDSQDIAYRGSDAAGGRVGHLSQRRWRSLLDLVGSGFGNGAIRALGVARGGDTVYAVLDSIVFVGINKGSTWSQQGRWDTRFAAQALVVDPTDPAHVFAMTSTALLVTYDAGRTWRAVAPPVTPFAPTAFACAPSGSDIYAGTANALYKSSNEGVTWEEATALKTRSSVRSILWDAQDRRIGFVATEDTVYRTTNGGLAWSELRRGLGPMQVYDVVQAQRNDLFVATAAGVWLNRVGLPPLPTATATATASATATATATRTPTATATATVTVSATATASATPTVTATATVIPSSPTPTVGATAPSAVTPTLTATGTAQPAPSPTQPAAAAGHGDASTAAHQHTAAYGHGNPPTSLGAACDMDPAALNT